MHPVRQILNDAPAMVEVPPELRHQRIEVIFSPLAEASAPEAPFDAESVIDEVRRLISHTDPVELGDFRLDLTGFRFDREEANAR